MSVDLLITGGDGMLGAALKRLCPDAVFVSRRDYDLRDLSQVSTMFDVWLPARIIHLATNEGGIKRNAAYNADLFSDNVQTNTNVLSQAQRFGVSRCISLLASCAFPTYPDRPSTEDDLHLGMPYEGNLGYGYAKRMLDVYTRLLWKQYKCRFSTVTPVTMYGPKDEFDPEKGHVIGSLIRKVAMAKISGGPVEVWGSGRAVRQFVFVQDVARVLLQALDLYTGPETVIVAPDDGLNIRQLTFSIAKLADYQGPILFDRSKPEGVLNKRLKSNRFGTCFPGFSFTPLDEGLTKTLDWFESHAMGIGSS